VRSMTASSLSGLSSCFLDFAMTDDAQKEAEWFEEYWRRLKGPSRMSIILTPQQVYAIGLVIVQWSAFDEQVNRKIDFWKQHPQVPPDIRSGAVGPSFKRRLAYLRDHLAPHAIPKNKPDLAADFAKGMALATGYKGKREWFAHGTFALNDNRNEDMLCVTYGWHKFSIATAKIFKLADEIALLTGWLLAFDARVHEDAHRALLDKLRQLAALRKAGHSPPTDAKPQDPPESSQA